MKRFRYKSKNDHLEIKLDVYSPRETVQQLKRKLAKWKAKPKSKKRKHFSIKIERK